MSILGALRRLRRVTASGEDTLRPAYRSAPAVLAAVAMIASGVGIAGGEPNPLRVTGGLEFDPRSSMTRVVIGGGDFAIRYRGDPYCNRTVAEVPHAVGIFDIDSRKLATRIAYGNVFNALIAVTVKVDTAGRVTDMDIKPIWPGSDYYLSAIRENAKNWRFSPGYGGTYCMALYVDADDEVGKLFRVPKVAAPRPSLATELPYPEYAYGQRVGGAVTLSIDIDKTGKVTEARVVEETPAGYLFGQAAAETVQTEWEFKGAKPGRYALRVRFAL